MSTGNDDPFGRNSVQQGLAVESVDVDDFDDFDDGTTGSEFSSRKTSYDDDDGVQIDASPVDLNSFLMGKRSTPTAPAPEVQIKTNNIADKWEDDSDEGELDDEEFETEEEEDEMVDELDPSDEPKLIETTSQELLQMQLEHNKKVAKDKKRALVKEYLQDIKHFYQLKKRNTILRFKITATINQKQQVVDKYVKMQLDAMENAKEAERLKRLHILESCAAVEQRQKEMTLRKRKKKKNSKKKSMNKKVRLQTRFQSMPEYEPDIIVETKTPEPTPTKNEKHDMTMTELKDSYLTTVKKAITRRMKVESKGKCTEHPKEKKSKRLLKFSFKRSMMLGDVIFPKTEGGVRSRMLNIRIGSEEAQINLGRKSLRLRKQSLMSRRRRKFRTTQRESKFKLTKEARLLAKSKSRMALEGSKQQQQILIETAPVELNNLNQFKFEFADQRLSSKRASVLIREDVIKMLRHRHIPTSHLTWPLQVKGVNYSSRNPYGRIHLNYTRLSHHEKEHPFTAYRIILTNLAYLRIKEQRMLQSHSKAHNEMEEERKRLFAGMGQILHELIEGLRIWASLSGITCQERYEAKRDTENLIEDLQNSFEYVLLELFAELYRTIQSNEFALRKLAISEGKGEGAELHEFKEIMRCREKLKAEHQTVQQIVTRYQSHSVKVLRNIRRADKKIHEISETIDQMSGELRRFKGLLKNVSHGLSYCQGVRFRQQKEERVIKALSGILPAPAVVMDYQRMKSRKIDDLLMKQELKRRYVCARRELIKLDPMRFI